MNSYFSKPNYQLMADNYICSSRPMQETVYRHS